MAYEVDTQVNFRDRYNWDGGKATQIAWYRQVVASNRAVIE